MLADGVIQLFEDPILCFLNTLDGLLAFIPVSALIFEQPDKSSTF